MIEEVEYQNQHGQAMHSRNEYQNSGSMQMPSHGHGMMKPHMQPQGGYMPSHNGGFISGMTHQQPMGMHQQPMGSGMTHQQPMGSGMMPMGHCSSPNMSSTTMNATNFSSGGGMMGGPNMSRTEYDSFQKVSTPGGMHESKYHHQEQSGYGHGHGHGHSGGMGYGMGYGGGRRAEWATKAL